MFLLEVERGGFGGFSRRPLAVTRRNAPFGFSIGRTGRDY